MIKWGSSVTLPMLQMLNSHRRLMATVLFRGDREHFHHGRRFLWAMLLQILLGPFIFWNIPWRPNPLWLLLGILVMICCDLFQDFVKSFVAFRANTQPADYSLTKVQAGRGQGPGFGQSVPCLGALVPPHPPRPPTVPCKLINPNQVGAFEWTEARRQRAGPQTPDAMALAGNATPPYVFREPFGDDICVFHE